ncbi:MAG: phage holin family protein [Chthonomonadales bacterium]|nr:phage holin family protein [Chthonomonadales bacterium]
MLCYSNGNIPITEDAPMGSRLCCWAANTVALALLANLNVGIHYADVPSLVIATLAIGLANTFVLPILQLVALPLSCVTFGLSASIMSMVLFYVVAAIVPGFDVTIMGAVVGSLVTGLVTGMIGRAAR